MCRCKRLKSLAAQRNSRRIARSDGPFDDLARRDKVLEQADIDLGMPFVLGKVADLVRLVQHAPDLGSEAQGVRQHLEDDVAMLRPIALATKCGKAQGMRGVVGEIETTLR